MHVLDLFFFSHNTNISQNNTKGPTYTSENGQIYKKCYSSKTKLEEKKLKER